MLMLWQDLRYAVRTLLKSRSFTAAAVVVLALGIGANSAIFTVVNTVLLRPMPFSDPDRIVKIYHFPPQKSFPGVKLFAVSPANYLDWRVLSHSFDGMAAYAPRAFALTGIDRPETVRGAIVDSEFFSILGTQAELGRTFSPEEEQPGRGRVAVVSHAFWETHFGSNPGVLGRKLILYGEPYTIVGVMPAKFHFKAWTPVSGDVWIPLGWDTKERAERKIHNYLVIAKLKPGVSIPQARADMNAVSSQLALQYPDADREWGAVVMSLDGEIVKDVRPSLLILLGAVAFVLLIACANVANLITARNLARSKEIAVRAALGASRGRALQQLLCESLILSFAGGLAGFALGKAVLPLLSVYVSQQYPLDVIPLDTAVILFTLGISIATGVLAGALPAWRGSKADLNDALKQGTGRSATDRGARVTRSALVAAEVALSLMLLAGAGLMIRTLWILSGVNAGFDPHNVLTLTATVSNKRFSEPIERASYFGRVLTRLRSLPGVQSAGAVDRLPMEGGAIQPFVIEGRPVALFAQQPTVSVREITPGYLRTMRVPLLRGRDFRESDALGKPDVVLISESMAKSFWPGEDPIGKRLTLSFVPDRPRVVVGIVGDVKLTTLDRREPSPTLYETVGLGVMSLVIRTAVRPESLVSAITNTVEQMDPEEPVRDVRTMQSIIDESVSGRRTTMLLLAAFAALALLLAAFGLYSVLAYTVRRRVREIGIRMALGASVRDVLRIIVLGSLRPTFVGIAIGLLGAVMLSGLLTKLIYGVYPNDPLTFAAAALVLTAVALAASVIPAWRATKVDPLQVLREE